MNNRSWDYLIVTASHEDQASAYQGQLNIRKNLGLIPQAEKILAIADPGGKRVGSGGSTIFCLLKILSRELAGSPRLMAEPSAWLGVLSKLRILIVHAGGDSKRIPAYGACGKIFIPVPGDSDRALGMTLFDRLLPTYFSLPPGPAEQGQVVVATGDVLLSFDGRKVRFSPEGIMGLGCYAVPELAKNHGVFCPDAQGRVRRFLQKPTPAEQAEKQGIHRHGQSVLDIGVMNLNPSAAVRLIQICDIRKSSSGELTWAGALAASIETAGLDFYREITCAMGTEANFKDYLHAVRRSGSNLDESLLRHIFDAMSKVPFNVCILPQCGFLHFGTSRQLIYSGNDLLSMDYGTSHSSSCLSINNDMSGEGQIVGSNSWVEGCRIQSPLTLAGENVVIGIDVEAPLSIPAQSVVDVLKGKEGAGRDIWFVRCYGIDDVFHRTIAEGARLCRLSIPEWLKVMDAAEDDIWDPKIPPAERQAWQARIFPAVSKPQHYRDWLWMLAPDSATPAQKKAWKAARRHSFSEMAGLASIEDFYSRRLLNRFEDMRRSLRRPFRHQSGFSASELAFIFQTLGSEASARWIIQIVKEACAYFGEEKPGVGAGLEQLELSRILHTLGSAILKFMPGDGRGRDELLRYAGEHLSEAEKKRLASLGIESGLFRDAASWARAAQEAAFENVSRTIVFSKDRPQDFPKNALRTDEIIWGRAPARLDLGGGWSDTPPYSLEHGGCVINAAVNLNGQPPIHVYARVIDKPEIRISSIDLGAQITIRDMDELLDYRKPTSQFGLAKATLALAGFSCDAAKWPRGMNTLEEMMIRFGGGIELTTLAAIPSGSGLGTSSIMGAVLMAVVHRLIGRDLSARQLFYNVLRLEQELTTGGGWQDQVGGAVGGVKMITTEAGIVPDPRIHYVPQDVLDPRLNHGRTLLYYTGLRRLAKNILHYVVGNYLDRDRAAMETLRKLHAFPPVMVEAMAAKDIRRFGELIDVAWNLNKRIDPDSTTEVIEEILARIKPHIYGAKLLGAGGGGFLLMACRTQKDAAAVHQLLNEAPPNDRARFFDFDISAEGLAVTVS